MRIGPAIATAISIACAHNEVIAVETETDGTQEVIVTGTRRTERTAVDSSVPVDVLNQADLGKTVSHDLNNKLQALVPSYSVKRLPLNDGAIFVRPAALRDLSHVGSALYLSWRLHSALRFYSGRLQHRSRSAG